MIANRKNSRELAFEIHGSPEADLVPPLEHARLEVEAVDRFLRLRDDECSALGMDGACRIISIRDRRVSKDLLGSYHSQSLVPW